MLYIILSFLCYPFVWLATRRRRRQSIQRILVVQTAKIGDVICSTPVFRAVARQFPEAKITVLVHPVSRDLLDGNPNVHTVMAVRPAFYSGFAGKVRLARFVRGGRYDVAISLNPNVHFAIGLFWGLVPVRLSVLPQVAGSTFRLAGKLFTHLAPHAGDRLVLLSYFEMLRHIGVESHDLKTEVVKSPGADEKASRLLMSVRGPVVGIAISSGNKLKELGQDKIVALVDKLLSLNNVALVLMGSVADREQAVGIAARFRNSPRIIEATGAFSLKELPALLERLAVFVGVDSGLTFMADACGVPIVEIVGPGPIEEQRPLGRCVFIRRSLPCVPCLQIFQTVQSCRIGTRECIESVTAEEIFEGVKLLLDSKNRTNHRA